MICDEWVPSGGAWNNSMIYDSEFLQEERGTIV